MLQKNHYVDSAVLERHWLDWLQSEGGEDWERIASMVYQICLGVGTKFSPRDELEREEMAHDAFITTIEKIKNRRLKFEEGRGKAFNLVTTAVHRHMQSRLNRRAASFRVLERYRQRKLDENPDLRKNIVGGSSHRKA